jgi:hypothetical protein
MFGNIATISSLKCSSLFLSKCILFLAQTLASPRSQSSYDGAPVDRPLQVIDQIFISRIDIEVVSDTFKYKGDNSRVLRWDVFNRKFWLLFVPKGN